MSGSAKRQCDRAQPGPRDAEPVLVLAAQEVGVVHDVPQRERPATDPLLQLPERRLVPVGVADLGFGRIVTS
jgi:hypothetical protein